MTNTARQFEISASAGTKKIDRRFCIAPMMDWTDRHCRYFLRLLFPHAHLYTEMVTTGALLHGDVDRFLKYDASEHPLALQLGGSDPSDMTSCARLAEDYGYDEVNINVGCPSDRVQSGAFGACLMREPETVANCIVSMQQAVSIPVTVKTRIGVDEMENYEDLQQFIRYIVDAGCKTVIIHARKAWLQGLSPRENREIPPLRYELVYQLKKDFPALEVIINGGIKTLQDVQQQLLHVDGVMIGREAYQNPYALTAIEKTVFAMDTLPDRHEVVQRYIPYIRKQLHQGVYLKHMSRHLLGLFQGQSGARAWRRYLSEHAHQTGADERVILAALAQVQNN